MFFAFQNCLVPLFLISFLDLCSTVPLTNALVPLFPNPCGRASRVLSMYDSPKLSSHLCAHVVNRLLRENRKSIPKFLSRKKTLKKCNRPDFKELRALRAKMPPPPPFEIGLSFHILYLTSYRLQNKDLHM